MDWKRRRTLPSSTVKRVAIVGGESPSREGIFLTLKNRLEPVEHLFLKGQFNEKHIRCTQNRCQIVYAGTSSAHADFDFVVVVKPGL